MDCEDCKEEIRKMMSEDCQECGPKLTREQLRLALVGMDAVALFPSLTGKRTGRIVRERIEVSQSTPEKLFGKISFPCASRLGRGQNSGEVQAEVA